MSKKKMQNYPLNHNPLTNRANDNWDRDIGTMIHDNGVYFSYFANIAMTLFEWVNLPKTCNADFLEYTLFMDGKACFVNDKLLGYLNLRYTDNGQPNIYMLPSKITAYSINYTKNFDEDFVICRNNIQYLPTALYVEHFTNIIRDIEETARVNLKAQKTPVTFVGDKEQILMLENLLAKYDSNTPYILLKKDALNNINVEVLKTDAPFLADKLTQMKEQYKNEFFSFLGINNADEKRERLLTDEVNANNQFISLNFETMYNERKRFCKEVNEKFGLNIDVRPRVKSMILEADKGGSNELNEGGVING